MRTKLTNILQLIVLLTGVIYILTGLVFFYSPVRFVEFFLIDVTDDWFKAIQYDTFIAPLFFLARGFAAMILAAGLSMILPLYDPLKYRGLIYYTGIVYPVLSSIIFLFNGIKFEHWILTIFGITNLAIFIANLTGLIITHREAKAGIE